MKVALYIRVSTRDQNPEMQINALTEKAKQEKWDYELFKEQESTRKTRPIKYQLYQRLLKKYERYGIPTTRECLALMTENFEVEKSVLDHCKAVSRLALGFGQELNMVDCEMDLDLLVAAGLLHDLARKQPHHATVAAQVLAGIGFPDVAEIVGAHMDIVIHDENPIDEREVLYLADKLVQEDQTVHL